MFLEYRELDGRLVFIKRLYRVKQDPADIWLAPDLQWYPVKLRYTESDGDYIEQTLREVRGQPAK